MRRRRKSSTKSKKSSKKTEKKNNEEKQPFEFTEGQLRTAMRGALREVWSHYPKRKFIESVRFKSKRSGRERYYVMCNEATCSKVMALSEKIRPTNADGSVAKRETLAYQVDHIDGCGSFTNIEEHIAEYTTRLLRGEMQILCYECHQAKTKKGNA